MKHAYRLISVLLVFIGVNSGKSQVTLQDSFLVDGLQRTFMIYVPAMYSPGTPVPLVFNLHGYGSNNLEQFLYTNFQPIADTANFIMVLPNGSLDLTNTLSWNTFGISSVDDVGFISQLIDTISSRYTIDAERIYSTGMSNGGFMSYELACQLSSRITAIVPIMQIHGTMDQTVPYAGNFAFSSIDSLLGFWIAKNNCFPIAEFNAIPDINLNDNCTAEHYVWNSSSTMSSVEFYKILGGDHSWPGAIINLNTTNMDFSASKEIWRFFRQYRKSDLVSSNVPDIAMQPSLQVFPNPSSGKFNFHLNSNKNFKYSLFDQLGKEVISGKGSSQTVEISLAEKGIYFLIVVHGTTRITRKLIVQ
jgi:polyhydroxybutyrate depolymerase